MKKSKLPNNESADVEADDHVETNKKFKEDEDSDDEEDIIGANDEYIILAETDWDKNETWYNFLRKEDNEEELKKLAEDLAKVDFEDESIDFEKAGGFIKIDLENPVPGFVAKWMTTVEINTYYHRKFDGKLKPINFHFKSVKGSKRKTQQSRANKIFNVLGGGQIEKYIDAEDELEFEDDEDTDNDSVECPVEDDTDEDCDDADDNEDPSDLGTSF